MNQVFMADSLPQFRKKLRQIMNHPVMDHLVGLLILVSVGLLFMEILHPSTEGQDGFLYYELGLAVNILFAFELSLRAISFRHKGSFFRSYWVDILSLAPLVVPQYGFLRALRLLRIFRLGPLMRQSNRRLSVLFRKTIGEQMVILSIVLVVVVGVTLGIQGTEGPFQSLDKAFWWTVLSLAAAEPIGVTPETPMGKFFTLIIIFGGITIFALFTGTVSAVITERLRLAGSHGNDMTIEEIEDHYIICGWNRSFRTLLEELISAMTLAPHSIVLVAEKRPDVLNEFEDNPHLFFVEGDYTTIDVLKRVGVGRAKRAILLADRSIPGRSDQDRDARTILAAMIIEKLQPGIFTCAELLSRENESHLRLAGIEEVVIGDEYSATILATSSRVEGVTHIADDIFSAQYGSQFYKVMVRDDWAGKTFLELQVEVKKNYDALLIAVEQSEDSQRISPPEEKSPYERTRTNPPGDYVFQKGDLLILLARIEPKW